VQNTAAHTEADFALTLLRYSPDPHCGPPYTLPYSLVALLFKLEKHSIEVQNSLWPLDHLTLTLTFDLIFIGRRGIVMDYLCAKFGYFSFSRFGFIVRTDRQNYRGA